VKKMRKQLICGIVSMLLVFLLVAALAPTTMADVRSQAGFSLDKQTYPNPTAAYKVGDPISYKIIAENNGFFNCEVDIWDVLPDGDIVYLENDSYFTVNETKTYWVNRTVEADWVDGDKIRNYAWAVGLDENPTLPDEIEMYMVKTSPIMENEPPSFKFTFDGIGCLEVEFNGSASFDPDGSIVNHTWDYGDGATEGPTAGPPTVVSHTYATCGWKTVKLSGYDNHSFYNETVKAIYVACPPKAIAGKDPGCFEEGGSIITFDGSQSYAESPNTIVNWSWTFSDGVKGSNDWSSTTSRAVNSTVTATLTVRDSLGCEDSASVRVPPCTQVPLLTTLGLIVLIGVLSAVLLVSKYRKVH